MKEAERKGHLQKYMQNTNQYYRPEIDGLRAIAVLAVIFFHAGFTWFSGGYVGVDVFFVISGYLIANILIRERLQTDFSLVKFYERRIRRIIPALFVVMLASVISAWFILAPTSYKHLGITLLFVSTFISNVFFSSTSNYFDQSTDFQPLHHTWSLSVEEQFYLIFPIIFMVFLKFGKKKTTLFILSTSIASLIITEYMRRHYPVSGFYLIKTRIWELLIGSFIAIIMNTPTQLSKYKNNYMATFGLLAVLSSIFFYTKHTPFLSKYTLLPTLGTACIILFAEQRTIVAKILSLPVLVAIGLISYSAYLWHQPLLAYSRIYNAAPLSTFKLAGIILGSLVLSYFTWRYIEQPFRDRNRVSTKKILILYITGVVFFISIGFFIYCNEGFESRIESSKLELLAFNDKYQKLLPDIYQSTTCFLGEDQSKSEFQQCATYSEKPSILLWGDSYAAHLYFGLKKIWQKKYNINHFSASACAPLLGEDFPIRPYCKDINYFIIDEVRKHKPDMVILSAAWQKYPNWNKLEKTIDTLKNLNVYNIYIIGPTPEWPNHFGEIIASMSMDYLFDKIPYYMNLGLDLSFMELDQEMKNFAIKKEIHYISAANILCSGSKCITRAGNNINDLLYWDCGHLTAAGSELLVSKFEF